MTTTAPIKISERPPRALFDVKRRVRPIPAGRIGDYAVQPLVVRAEDEERQRLRCAITGGRRIVPEGIYTQLVDLRKDGDGILMSDTPDEIRDHHAPIIAAWELGGRVLIHGLGLGVVLDRILDIPHVTSVDVVEKSPEVIALVGPAYRSDPRVHIREGDAFTYSWLRGTRWNVVWHDIWPDASPLNLDEMATLHRKFGGRTLWQGSWRKEEMVYLRSRGRWR